MAIFYDWEKLQIGDRINVVGTPLILDNKGDHLFRTLEVPYKEMVVKGSIPVDHGTVAFVDLVITALQPVMVCGIDDSTGVFPLLPCQMADMFRIVELCSGMGAFSSVAKQCGFTVCAGVDQNEKWQQLFEEIHPGAKFLHGDCSCPSIMQELYQMNAGHSMVLAGFSCQPHSRGGDRLGMMDSRSDSLPKALHMSWMLQSPITILECVSEVLHDKGVQKILEDYCASTGSHITQQVLRLSNFWPTKRDRWFACITAGILGPIRVPDLPVCHAFSSVVQVVPYLQAWPQTDMDQLILTDYELQKFLKYSKGGIAQRYIDMNGILPTCLHSAGNQIFACKCGCRGPLSDRRLQERGLFGTLVPIDAPEGVEQTLMCRYLHPREMFILNGGNPMIKFQDLRLGLGAVGQCVSPFHGIWMLSHVASHLAAFLQHDVVDPQYCIHQYVKWLLDRRDECWPPKHVSQLKVSATVKSCLRVPFENEHHVLRAEEIVQPVIHIQDDSTGTVLAFRTDSSTTVQQFVQAQTTLQGDNVKWPKTDQGEIARADMQLETQKVVIPGDVDMSTADLPPCPCESWNDITPTIPIQLDPVFEQASCTVEALTQLRGNALLDMVGPHVTESTLEALVDAKIAKDARMAILANQAEIWADDEIRVFLHQIASKGPIDQHLCVWDPLVVSSIVATGRLHLLHTFVEKLGSHATVISAVLVEKHWHPILWRVEPQGILGFTNGVAAVA